MANISPKLSIGNLKFDAYSMKLTIQSQAAASPRLVVKMTKPALYPTEQVTLSKKENTSIHFGDKATLQFEQIDEHCYKIKWKPHTYDFIPQDNTSLKDAFWYGGGELFTQYWPMNKQEVKMSHYVSLDLYQGPFYGSVLERYWISSQGIGIFVPNEVPLHVSWNAEGDEQFCMKADYRNSSYPNKDNSYPNLEYTICEASNVKEVHQLMLPKFLDIPRALPDERIFKSPIWSTWVRYKMNVNEKDVMELADEIDKYGFSSSQIEIDDMYTTHYGEFNFDPKKFPNGKTLIDKLHAKGFRVTSWVIPFANTDSPAFREGMEMGFWIKDASGNVPALTKWWQGIGTILDFTNPKAVEWYLSRLRKFQDETGMDSFKFDAGEGNWLPSSMSTFEEMKNPNEYTTKYVEALSQLGGAVEARVGYRSQKYPIFVRMMDKDSRWGNDNGLKTLIPNALLMSILGYPFILPDMIGGNGYADMESALSSSSLPSKELFIRWTQISAYLPAMQFSFVPWQYDDETIEITRKMVREHEDVVYPLLIEAANETVKSGTPIIRPLWWLAPDDKDALSIESEYLLGDSLLVAPIVEDEGRSRDIYLPKGKWIDQLRGGNHEGPSWLRDYRIELREIATFRLTTN